MGWYVQTHICTCEHGGVNSLLKLNPSHDLLCLVFGGLACYCHGHRDGGRGYFSRERLWKKLHSREQEGQIVFACSVIQGGLKKTCFNCKEVSLYLDSFNFGHNVTTSLPLEMKHYYLVKLWNFNVLNSIVEKELLMGL